MEYGWSQNRGITWIYGPGHIVIFMGNTMEKTMANYGVQNFETTQLTGCLF